MSALLFFKIPNYDDNSGNGGITSKAVNIQDLLKPLYEKIRVIGIEANIVKQDKITEELIYTAKVEKFSNDTWAETTDLQETQKLQLNWHFIKNNDELDEKIQQDNPTDDDITIDGLSMRVKIQDDNIQKFGHAHCFVNSPDNEDGHIFTQLQRQLDVQEVLGRNLLDVNATEVNYTVELNIDNPTKDEIESLTVEILEKDSTGKETTIITKVKDDLTIQHTLTKQQEDINLVEVRAKVYPKEYPDNSGLGISYLRPIREGEEVVNVRIDDESDEYINNIKDDNFYIRADTSLKNGTSVNVKLHSFNHLGKQLAMKEETTYVENSKIEYIFNLTDYDEEFNLKINDIDYYKGEIEWEKR